MDMRQNFRPLLITGVISAVISLFVYFINDGKVASVWAVYLAGFVGGLVTAWLIRNVLPLEIEAVPIWSQLATVLIGGFIGMGVGQTLRFRLIDIPRLAAVRSDINFSIEFDIASFFDNLRNTYSLLYLGFMVLGVVIGLFGRKILNVVVKWALDYKP